MEKIKMNQAYKIGFELSSDLISTITEDEVMTILSFYQKFQEAKIRQDHLKQKRREISLEKKIETSLYEKK